MIVLSASVLTATAGCGRGVEPTSRRHIEGMLVWQGMPFVHSPQELIEVTFLPPAPVADAPRLSAFYNPGEEGFDLIVPAEHMPPGIYKIAITRRASDRREFFDGVFTETVTPLRYTVTSEPKQSVVIDLNKREVSVRPAQANADATDTGK